MENKEANVNNVSTKEAAKLRHSHSTPPNRKKETFNPLLFRNSRSNIYKDSRDEDSNEQKQQSQQNLQQQQQQQQQQQSQPAADSNEWKINDIEEFPTHFEVQRTHCIVHGISANAVATRISTFLKDAADSILYDNDNAIAHVEMNHGLRLIIRLFKTMRDGDDDDDDDDSQDQDGRDNGKERCVLVELTRREGCSAKFHSIATKVLAAAQGIEGDEALKKLEENTLTPKPLKVSSELRQAFLKQVKINP